MQQPATPAPDDNQAYRFPVSIKGVVFLDGKVVLLRNPRDEWELPGGKLELGETPQGCLAREVSEELSLPVKVGPLLDSWVYHIAQGVDVLIVTYGCYPESSGEVVPAPSTRRWDFSPRPKCRSWICPRATKTLLPTGPTDWAAEPGVLTPFRNLNSLMVLGWN